MKNAKIRKIKDCVMQEIIREEGGTHFTVRALFKELKKKMLLVVALILVATAIGGIYGGLVVDTKYTTTSTMIVNVGADGTLEESQNLAKAFKSITESDTIYELTAIEYMTKYHYSKMKREELKNEIKSSITVTVDSMLLKFTMTSKLSGVKDILNILMRKVQEFVDSPKFDDDGEIMRDPETNEIIPVYPLFAGKVFIVSPATEPTDDADTKVFTNMVVFCGGGVLVSMLIIVLLVLFNNTYDDKASFEEDYDIDVLAMIDDISSLSEEDSNSAKGEV